MKRAQKKGQLSFGTKLSYGMGNLGYGSMGQTVSSFIMFFGTSVLGISGALVGVIIAITSLWDGLSDPLIGYLSDRTKSKFFGRRLGHMLFASFALAINNILLWSCPQGSQGVMVAWLLIFLLLQETFNTFFATPYSALCIDIAPDYNDQTKTQGFKTVFYILGLILPSVLMGAFMGSTTGTQAQFNKMGYVHIALVNSSLALLCGLFTIFGTRKRVRSMPHYDEAMVEGQCHCLEENETSCQSQLVPNGLCEGRGVQELQHSKSENLKIISTKARKNNNFCEKDDNLQENSKTAAMFETKENSARFKNKNGKQKKIKSGGHSLGTIMAGYVETFKKRDFRIVMLGYSVCLIATVFISSVGMHLFTFCFHFSSVQISILMICLFGGAILSQMLWVSVVKKYDKKQTLIFALCVMLFGIAMTSITFLFRTYSTPDKIFWFVLPCLFIAGIGSGALYSLPHSMYADVVTMEQYKTGINNAGRYTGYYTFTYNFSNSIALLFIGLLLDLVKFDSSQPVQALAVQTGLGRIVFFGSAIAITCAILIFSKYSLKRADVLKVQIQANEVEKRK